MPEAKPTTKPEWRAKSEALITSSGKLLQMAVYGIAGAGLLYTLLDFWGVRAGGFISITNKLAGDLFMVAFGVSMAMGFRAILDRLTPDFKPKAAAAGKEKSSMVTGMMSDPAEFLRYGLYTTAWLGMLAVVLSTFAARGRGTFSVWQGFTQVMALTAFASLILLALRLAVRQMEGRAPSGAADDAAKKTEKPTGIKDMTAILSDDRKVLRYGMWAVALLAYVYAAITVWTSRGAGFAAVWKWLFNDLFLLIGAVTMIALAIHGVELLRRVSKGGDAMPVNIARGRAGKVLNDPYLLTGAGAAALLGGGALWLLFFLSSVGGASFSGFLVVLGLIVMLASSFGGFLASVYAAILRHRAGDKDAAAKGLLADPVAMSRIWVYATAYGGLVLLVFLFWSFRGIGLFMWTNASLMLLTLLIVISPLLMFRAAYPLIETKLPKK